ncbi:MAG: hypothetical protein Q7J73_05805 [Dehalococcoidales bacterium]|nr:hypothetical protein [Dehalococcoidales bacterium]
MVKTERWLQNLNLPEDIKPIFLSIADELVWLNVQWKFYDELFIDKKDQSLIMSAAKTFFMSLERIIRHSIILGICHLSDPPEVILKGKPLENLSLANLIRKHPTDQTVLDSFAEFKRQSSSFHPWRNKLIAHSDLETILAGRRLPAINQDKIQKCLDLAGNVLKGLAMYHGNSTPIGFEPLIKNGTYNLKQWLKEGLSSRERRLPAIKEGFSE